MSKGLIPHPIPYQGSKRGLAPTILGMMPRGEWRLVEPFAGSAAISLAAAYERRASTFWLNDAHAPLIALWNMILDEPQNLSRKYSRLWREQTGRERQYFDKVRARFNRDHQPADFFYLLARCVKAAIRYNAAGEFNNTPDNRRRGARPDEMRCRIMGASVLLAGRTTTTCTDYRAVLDDCCERDLVYMDPPYQGVSNKRDNRYAPRVVHDEFCECLGELNRRKIMYIVSYDGRTGEKRYGERLPASLGLEHLEICAGRSTQATLLGRDHLTYESLYLSGPLASALRRSVDGRLEDRLRIA
jgi:DNA adenine methylase